MIPSLHYENVEGNPTYIIPPLAFQRRRRPGISAFIRVKNEGKFLKPAVESILPLCVDIVICIQGEQDDDTATVAHHLEGEHQKVRVKYYPFDSNPNGPGHDHYQGGSVYERAYFYNWSLAQTDTEWALKWDGDMVAKPGAVATLLKLTGTLYNYDVISFAGDELCGSDMKHLSTIPLTGCEPRLFKVNPLTYYFSGPACEIIRRNWDKPKSMGETMFVHLKWVKPLDRVVDAWPENWKNHSDPQVRAHFARVLRKAKPGDPYTEPLPRELKDYAEGGA